MTANIKEIIENVKAMTESPAAISNLMRFERVLDEMDVYAYANWEIGELVEGPLYEKYFITCTFMWPYKKMPDPMGAKRLIQYDCEVSYKREILEVPTKVKTPYDFKPGTKFPKMTHYKVWLVSITIPRDLIGNIEKGSIEIENEVIDLNDIEEAYEEGTDEGESDNKGENNASQDEQNGEQEMMGGMGGMPGGNPQLPTQGGF